MDKPLLKDSEFNMLSNIIYVKNISANYIDDTLNIDELDDMITNKIYPILYELKSDETKVIKFLCLYNYKKHNALGFENWFEDIRTNIHRPYTICDNIRSGYYSSLDKIFYRMSLSSIFTDISHILNMIKRDNNEIDNIINILDRDLKLDDLIED